MNEISNFAECRDCLCLTTRRAAQRLTRAYDERLRSHGLTVNQFSMLTTLILAGPLTMAALAEHLGVDRTTLTRNVKLSERRGFVKVGVGKDARERVVSEAPGGRAAAEAALPDWRAAQRQSLAEAKTST